VGKILSVLFFAVQAVLAGCVSTGVRGAGTAEDPFTGPIPYRSVMPLSLVFPHPSPEGAAVLEAGRTRFEARADYGSVFVSDRRGSERILVDGEFSRTALAVRCGTGGRTEVGVEIPFLRYSSGSFDRFIEDWHSFFGLPQGKRDENPDNRYTVSYGNEKGTFFSADEDGFHLGDIPVTVKVGLSDPRKAAVGLALRGMVELPTGNESRGFGNGKVDGSAGVVVEKRFENLAFYSSLDEVIPGTPDSFEGVRAARVTHGSLAAEYLLCRGVAVIVQTDWQTGALTSARLREFDGPQWMGALGGAFRLGENSFLRVSMEEDFTTDSSPDFTVSTGLVWLF